MRDVLIEHLDGKPVKWRSGDESNRGRLQTIFSLIDRGLLRHCSPDGGIAMKRSAHTVMTERGRNEICYLLGEYADALVRAGFGEMFRESPGHPDAAANRFYRASRRVPEDADSASS